MKNKILKISVSVVSVLMGLCFLVQVLRIYFGEKTFTREIVSNYILQIIAVMIIWVILVICLQITLRKEVVNDKVKTSYYHTYKLLSSRIDSNALNNNIEIKKYRKIHKIILISSLVIFGIMGLLTCLYVCNPNNFIYKDGVNITTQIVQMVIHCIPWLIISFIVGLASSYVNDYYYGKMVSVCKVLLKDNKKERLTLELNKKKKIILYSVQACIIVLAVVFIIVGAIDGGYEGAHQKAINICTECIGLG